MAVAQQGGLTRTNAPAKQFMVKSAASEIAVLLLVQFMEHVSLWDCDQGQRNVKLLWDAGRMRTKEPLTSQGHLESYLSWAFSLLLLQWAVFMFLFIRRQVWSGFWIHNLCEHSRCSRSYEQIKWVCNIFMTTLSSEVIVQHLGHTRLC